jgi:hypothetical protein
MVPYYMIVDGDIWVALSRTETSGDTNLKAATKEPRHYTCARSGQVNILRRKMSRVVEEGTTVVGMVAIHSVL